MAGIIWTASQFEPVKPAEPTAGAERQVVVERTQIDYELNELNAIVSVGYLELTYYDASTLQALARTTGNRWTDECEYIPFSNYELARLSQLATAMLVKVSYFATSDRMFQLRSMFHDGTKIVSKIYTFKAIQLEKR
ncbi:hypothetical protein V1477_016399 [Vespula maculifrons]|uniref:Uncharacterized protein n=1 Tax=Vespula maculifrons TaxID=7453 RepID=A0ABD2BCW9_VESMC